MPDTSTAVGASASTATSGSGTLIVHHDKQAPTVALRYTAPSVEETIHRDELALAELGRMEMSAPIEEIPPDPKPKTPAEQLAAQMPQAASIVASAPLKPFKTMEPVLPATEFVRLLPQPVAPPSPPPPPLPLSPSLPPSPPPVLPQAGFIHVTPQQTVPPSMPPPPRLTSPPQPLPKPPQPAPRPPRPIAPPPKVKRRTQPFPVVSRPVVPPAPAYVPPPLPPRPAPPATPNYAVLQDLALPDARSKKRIYSHNTRAVWHARSANRTHYMMAVVLAAFLAGTIVVIWVSLGSPTSVENLPIFNG